MIATRIALVLVAAALLSAQEKVERPMRFFDAGWNNAHSGSAGVLSRTLFGEQVVSPKTFVSDFVFRPADHFADGTSEGASAGFTAETIAFPLELYGSGAQSQRALYAWTLPKDFDDALTIDHVGGCRLLRLGVEQSVAVGVRRAPDGSIVGFAHQSQVGESTSTADIVGDQIDARLPATDPGFLAGWHLAHLDLGISDLPEPLRSVAKSTPPIGVADHIEARVEETWFAADGSVDGHFVFGLRGAVAADGRFAFERTAQHQGEEDRPQCVTTELSCDLRAIYIGVRGWPVRCVWPRDHEHVFDVLRSQAGFLLPLIGWARDPYWLAPASCARWKVGSGTSDPGGAPRAVTVVDESTPDTGLSGTVRYLVDEQQEPPRVLRLATRIDPGIDRMVIDFDDERELAPGYRRPMRMTTRWYADDGRTLEHERKLVITAGRITSEKSVSSWRLAPSGARYALMR